tara:strand:+ start:1190 stop:1339 length:150 start_codon:yes stop_codon:yes gene_type:complete
VGGGGCRPTPLSMKEDSLSTRKNGANLSKSTVSTNTRVEKAELPSYLSA